MALRQWEAEDIRRQARPLRFRPGQVRLGRDTLDSLVASHNDLADDVYRREAEARQVYYPDGTVEFLDSAEEVVEYRKRAAERLEELEDTLDARDARIEHLQGLVSRLRDKIEHYARALEKARKEAGCGACGPRDGVALVARSDAASKVRAVFAAAAEELIRRGGDSLTGDIVGCVLAEARSGSYLGLDFQSEAVASGLVEDQAHAVRDLLSRIGRG